ncbi:MAG: aspartate/glutamate racemase family protein [Bacteroidales bacterium]|nr:aspartate/glutamate racemase family protein [Candidatus Cacconaster merdequi]
MKMRTVTSELSILFLLLAIAGCGRSETAGNQNTAIVNKALSDTSSNFYADFESYPEEMKSLPIGVFDSGTGGLTVVERILSLDCFDNITGAQGSDEILDFAGERFIYLADQANMPYGTYASEGKGDYLEELAVKDAVFLLSDKYYINPYEDKPSGEKPRVKIIVVACNTATAYGLKTIESMLSQSGSGVKVIGVINAGVRAALDQLDLDSAEEPVAVGVLATPGTISSGAYERTIREELGKTESKADITVVSQGSYGLAEAVDNEPDFVNRSASEPRSEYRGPQIGTEDGCIDLQLLKAYNFDFSDNKMLVRKNAWGTYTSMQLNDPDNYARLSIVSLVNRHYLSGSKAKIKAIILGCTHYPFVLSTLQDAVEELREYRERDGSFPYKELLADDIIFIDPAVYTAIECYRTLRSDGNLAFSIGKEKLDGYISVPSSKLSDACLTSEGHLTYEFKYGRESGTEDVSTKAVPFSDKNIDKENLSRIKRLLPYTYTLIAPSFNKEQ